jgi:hypothetical protein
MSEIHRASAQAGRRALRLLTYLATRAGFLAIAIVALVLLRASDLPWAGPVFVAAQLAIVALVRYGAEAYAEWADEYVSWLNAGDAQAWASWHGEYVAWSAAHRSRMLGQRPLQVAA